MTWVRRRWVCLSIGAAGILLALSVSNALGDPQITGAVHDQYGIATVTIDQGQTASFANTDIDLHNVTAERTGPDGNPLFASQTVGFGQTSAVSGTQYLTSGSYAFYCSIHPFMRGTLIVTSAGTPAPRPDQSLTAATPAKTTPQTAPASATAGRGATHTVILKKIAFHPRTLHIKHGEAVRWAWHDGRIPHNVTGQGFASSPTQSHGSFTVRFTRKGRFSYRCTLHPGMTGRVIVS